MGAMTRHTLRTISVSAQQIMAHNYLREVASKKTILLQQVQRSRLLTKGKT